MPRRGLGHAFLRRLKATVPSAQTLMGSHPDWVIQTARGRAEPIIDEGRAGHYDEAVGWLAKAQLASERAGRTAEWRDYLDGLIARHARKYKLVPMLQALRRKC